MIQTPTHSAVRKQRDQEDHKRMAYRRAIEEHVESRRLSQELGDYPERMTGFFLNPELGLLR